MMRVRHLLPFACAIAAACAAPQTAENAAAPSDRDCFNVRSVSGYGDVDSDTIRVRASPSRSYEIDLSGPMCNQIRWATAVAIESRPSSWICTGTGPGLGEVRFRDSGVSGPVTCYITAVRRAPEPEAAPAEAEAEAE